MGTFTYRRHSGGEYRVIQDECPRCHRERRLGRCDVPGPWEGICICAFCNGKLIIYFQEAESEKSRQERATQSPEERKAQAAKDEKDIYG